MRVKIRKLTTSGLQYAVPLCKEAEYACALLGQQFLYLHQLRLIHLMGCEIEVVSEEDTKQEEEKRSIYESITN